MHSKPLLKIILPFLLAALAMVMAMPHSASFGSDYKEGKEWNHESLFAQFDFPVLKSEEQLREERIGSSATSVPYFRFSEEVGALSLRKVESLEVGELKPYLVSAMKEIFAKGIVPDDEAENMSLSEVVYIQKGKHASKYPSSEVFSQSKARARLVSEVLPAVQDERADSILKASGVFELLVPNLRLDEAATRLVSEEAVPPISPTSGFVEAGQLIVSKGEIVTSEISQILDSYKKEYNDLIGFSGEGFFYWFGCVLTCALLVCLLAGVIFFVDRSIFGDSRLYCIILVFVIASVGAMLASRFNDGIQYWLPFTLAALILEAFVRDNIGIPVYMVSLLPLLAFSGDGAALYLIFLTGGLVSVYAFPTLGRGWKQFMLALISFAAMSMMFVALRLCNVVGGDIIRTVIHLFVSSILVVACYPVTFLFERLFNLVSVSRLSELCDTSNPLLRKLEHVAPGTFQHSLQVMNMSDAAARSIGANSTLVRAGALYHDIGKMFNPQCFVENESLLHRADEEKYHAGISPLQSASDIIKHVSDGVDLARKNHLPEALVDFIASHHGTTSVGYFYSMYLKGGGDASKADDFKYPGPGPKSKEQIILMLCDSIEAASRTLQSYSPEVIGAFVEKIVEDKMLSGQFSDADISVRELGIVKDSIKTYLGQMHHARISYPDDKKTRKININLKHESRKENN